MKCGWHTPGRECSETSENPIRNCSGKHNQYIRNCLIRWFCIFFRGWQGSSAHSLCGHSCVLLPLLGTLWMQVGGDANARCSCPQDHWVLLLCDTPPQWVQGSAAVEIADPACRSCMLQEFDFWLNVTWCRSGGRGAVRAVWRPVAGVAGSGVSWDSRGVWGGTREACEAVSPLRVAEVTRG